MYSFREQLGQISMDGLAQVTVLDTGVENGGFKHQLLDRPELPVLNDAGLLGAFDPKKQMGFGLVIEVPKTSGLDVFWLEGGNRRIKPLSDLAPRDMIGTFLLRVPTSLTLQGEYTTKSNNKENNAAWLMNTRDGQLKMWEIAIVTKIVGGVSRYHLSLQLVYQGEMYNEDGRALVPHWQFRNFKEWDGEGSLREFLDRHVRASSLPSASEAVEPALSAVEMADQRSEVIFFNQAKGWGLGRVADKEKPAFIYNTNVVGQEFPAFDPRQIVAYEKIEENPRGMVLLGVREI